MVKPAAEQHMTFAKAGRQGLLLFAGIGLSQLLSFARNSIVGHTLSPRDFGIAASITMLLQLVEMLSDLGHERLIVQAEDGGSELFISTAHTVAILRGLFLSVLLLAIGPYAAQFFSVPEAKYAFGMVAFVPLLKGVTHLDCRRAQRHLDNRPQIIVEALPQAVSLTATLPMLWLMPGYAAVVGLAILQALAGILVARQIATIPYHVAADREILRRLLSFGWPILLSALPLLAVYQGDRAIIGRLVGIEELAAYSAAFMMAMVPGMLAARAGNSLMLPILSSAWRNNGAFASRFALMTEATCILSALYIALFVCSGGELLTLAFGKAYAGHHALMSALAIMWALRVIQTVPGIAIMATGDTKPFVTAGMLRAAALPFAASVAASGGSLTAIAATGCAGEVASLLYLAYRLTFVREGLASAYLKRCLFIVPVCVTAAIIPPAKDLLHTALVTAALLLAVMASGMVLMPCVLGRVRRLIVARRTASSPQAPLAAR